METAAAAAAPAVSPTTQEKTEPPQDRVTLTQYGVVDGTTATAWPDGDFLRRIVALYDDASSSSSSITAEMWQTNARWALLHAFQHISLGRDEVLLLSSQQRIDEINAAWNGLTTELFARTGVEGSSLPEDALREFLTTWRSRGRVLQWTVLECRAGCQFPLHAHPNLELVYCIRGALHEIRWQGPTTRDTTKNPTEAGGPWSFASLRAGEWLVNAPGSIHKSFTASNEPCVLLALWGGAHTDLPELSTVTAAVNAADAKLCTGCNHNDTVTDLPVTFLPASERP